MRSSTTVLDLGDSFRTINSGLGLGLEDLKSLAMALAQKKQWPPLPWPQRPIALASKISGLGLEDQWPWPWPQRPLALASKTNGHALAPKKTLAFALASKTNSLGLGLKDLWPWPWSQKPMALALALRMLASIQQQIHHSVTDSRSIN